MSLVKSKQRVADHGEVFTPAWMVEAMLDLVKHETERIDARFFGARLWQWQLHPSNPARGFVYLTAVVDVSSRRVLAHKVAITLEACHAKEVIEQAFARWGKPDIVNTDQGRQFTATEFTDAVLGQGCQLSMDGRGAWRDNVFVERLWRSVKYERVYLKAYDSVSAARADIAEYLTWYNGQRAHSKLGDHTPDEHYLAKLPKLAMAA